MNTVTLSTKLSDCTVGELVVFLTEQLNKNTANPIRDADSVFINGEECYKGIAGIQKVFRICRSKAIQYKKSKWIKDAIIQEGRTIFIKKNLALSLYNERFSLENRNR